jgi:Xaa-Pro dipeptidase
VESTAIGSDLQEAQLDALVACSLENVYYLSGVALLTQRLIPTRLAFAVHRPDSTGSLVVCSIEEAQVRAESWITDVRCYTEFVDSPVQVLADLLKEQGLGESRVGIECAALGQRYFAELVELLPSAVLVDASDVLERSRMVKSAGERALLARAAAATEEAIRAAFFGLRINDTEAEVAERMESGLRGTGADGIAFTVLAAGPNAAMAHPSPGAQELTAGSLLRTDFGGYFGARAAGYMSDLARTAVVGEATAEQADIYGRLYEVHQLTIDAMAPGVRACDVFETCRRAFEERGLPFRMPHVGHGIGVSVHEMPMLNPQTTQELLPGMVLAVEPITHGPGGIFHVEDMVEITADGVRRLTGTDVWSSLPVVG